MQSVASPNSGTLKDSRERRPAAVCERVRSTLTIVRDESPNGHGLQRMCGDAGRAVVSGSRDAEQNYAIVRTERSGQFFHGLSPEGIRARTPVER